MCGDFDAKFKNQTCVLDLLYYYAYDGQITLVFSE